MIFRLQEALGRRMAGQSMPLAFMEGEALVLNFLTPLYLQLSLGVGFLLLAEFKKVARTKKKGKRKFAVKVCTCRAMQFTRMLSRSIALLKRGASGLWWMGPDHWMHMHVCRDHSPDADHLALVRGHLGRWS